MRTITKADEEWSLGLRETGGLTPPVRLDVTGKPLPRWETSIAIVGTRRPTGAGLDVARELAECLCQAGCSVVSGLALGIDAASHEAALRAGGHTVAILGCGLDVVYPKENARLKRRIEDWGTIASEYPVGTQPRAFHFPERNRIIAALAKAVVVVEGSAKSGALITARLALEANRDIYAVPGSVRNAMAQGPNELIRTGQASLVTKAEHIFEDLVPGLVWDAPRADPRRPPALDDDESAVLFAMDDAGNAPDRLCRTLSLRPGRLGLILARLEVRGLVTKRITGYELTRAGARARRAAVGV
jgi:DNA processing protein